MAFTVRRTVRFEEVDFAQVVYFPNFFGFCHQTFEDFFAAEAGLPYAELLKVRRVGFPTVHAHADFRAPLGFGEPCRIVMEIVKLGERSVTSRFRLYRGESDELCAEVETVTVAIEMGTFQARAIPPELREVFQRHLAT